MASGTQVLDCRTCIDHAYPNCTSHELYKGILEGASRGVFNGRIHVHQDAQKTDAKQSNQVLLLSDDAVIDTKPELEIYADDVRCTHGATVGDLDADALFYLRSRGLPFRPSKQALNQSYWPTTAFPVFELVFLIIIRPIRRSVPARSLPAEAFFKLSATVNPSITTV
jgi:hypothetical protein